MVIGASARDGTTSGRIGRDGNHIAVQAEVRHQGSGSSHFERIARVGGNHCSSLGPVDEGIARSGGGRQRGSLAMVISASASDGTASGRIGRSGNRIAVQAEVGNIGSRAFNRKANGRVGGDHCSFLGPVDEGIARSGGGRQRGGLAMVISPSACDGTASGRIGRGGNHIAVQAEVRYQSHSLSHFERVARVGGDHRPVLGPVDEGIARSGGGGQRGGLAMVISASASDGTTNGRVCRNGDFEGVLGEVSHV